ncbi:FitA-like ribbon-helix-helix domain-containing protein [Duganella sp. CT11-25]|uniref:FitA-like ribbon-helix-helix domain-containing protein n=1 Tax=unclassified Duganella TaxID=2636909 RepID=UPI0039AF4700
MAMLTVRNLPDDVHRALRVRAAQHGRSTEAEVREILAAAVKPESRIRLGDALAALGHKIGLTNDDVELLVQVRDETAAEPLKFERGFPRPDGYIAAIAASRGFIVASRDTAPFEAAGLTVINPWSV